MKNSEWVLTDPSCNQYRRNISKYKYEFKEDRIINPVTKETRKYNFIIDLTDYSNEEIMEACNTFGYDPEDSLSEKENWELIAEFLFELSEE